MYNEKIYFVTDLDKTIVHSKNKGFKCVETIDDREITYMTEVAYKKLQQILKVSDLVFVPCTMRNIKQTFRIKFIEKYNPKFIICTNGAQIYIDGKLDEEWNKKMKCRINIEELKRNIVILHNFKKIYKDSIDIIDIRNIEEFYIEIKLGNKDKANKFYKIINNKYFTNLNIIKIEAKIFIISKDINKINALNYLEEKYQIKNLITAGDSVVDEEFTKKGISILPKHSSFSHNMSIITSKENINSTEEILDIVKEKIEYFQKLKSIKS